MPPRATAHLSGGTGTRRTARRRAVAHGGGGHEGGGKERWMVSYADMLTLLLVLFIVLFSISIVNKSKFEALSESLKTAFGIGPENILSGGQGLLESASNAGTDTVVAEDLASAQQRGLTIPVPDVDPKLSPYAGQVADEIKNYDKIKKDINDALARQHMTGDLNFSVDHRGLIITVVTNDLLFPGNKATLIPGGQTLLSVIAPPLSKAPNQIEVDGFTNQLKVSIAPWHSGWELSSARASAVAHYLETHHIAEKRLSAVGYGENNPLYAPGDPRSVAMNRRVEIVVLSTLPPQAAAELEAKANDK